MLLMVSTWRPSSSLLRKLSIRSAKSAPDGRFPSLNSCLRNCRLRCVMAHPSLSSLGVEDPEIEAHGQMADAQHPRPGAGRLAGIDRGDPMCGVGDQDGV